MSELSADAIAVDEVADAPVNPSRLERADYLGLVAILGVVLIVKLIMLSSVRGPVVFGDENIYARYARILSTGVLYKNTHYPPLYPLILAPLHFLGQQWYDAAKVLNAVLSTAMLIPAYLIARLGVERRWAMACTVVVALVPFHYTLPRTLLSENLFFPLLLLAVYMVLKTPDRRTLLWDLATAALLGALYLTRYVSLALIPAFYLVWWLRPFSADDRLFRPSWRKVGRLAMMLAVTVAVFAPWVVGETRLGAPFGYTLGFGITRETHAEQLTFQRLLAWAGIYGAYFALLAGPILGVLLLAPIEAFRSRTRGYFERLVVLVLALWGGTMVAVVRHSWRAAYNLNIWAPGRVMGRYAIYFSALFIILAFVSLPQLEKWFAGGRRRIGIAVQAAAIVALIGAWLVVFQDATGIALRNTITDRGAVDLYRLIVAGWPALVVAMLVVAALAFTLMRRPAWSYIVLTGGLALWLVLGVPGYLQQLAKHQVYAEHGRQLAAAVEQLGLKDAPLEVRIDPAVGTVSEVNIGRIRYGMEFWGATGLKQQGNALVREATGTPVVLDLEVAPAGTGVWVSSYQTGGNEYEIVRLAE